MKIKVLIFAAIIALHLNVKAQQSMRLINNWSFVKGDLGSPWEAFRPEKLSKLPVWHAVTLPHCFNAFDAVDPDISYYQGPGWYRTFLNVKNPYKNGRTILYFEGSGQKTDVYVFTKKVGKHIGGYDKFSVDLTDPVKEYLKKYPQNKSKIPIAVRCDNSRDVNRIPSDLSDFTIYGGLYRYVDLQYLPSIFLSQIHVDYALDDKNKNATVKLNALFNNYVNNEIPVTLKILILDKKNRIVGKFNKEMISWVGDKEFANFNIKNIHLWSPDKPYLYTLDISMQAQGIHFEKKIKIGFRTIKFVEKGPFLLNGKRLLLRGMHLHEDYAGYGAALPEKLMRKELVMMKDMGANFVRLAHYQQSDIVLNLCDSLGILVWEEIPWCRGGIGNGAYQNQAKQMLKNMINQHYNHVAIIIWGLGNENDWPGDFQTFDKDSIRQLMTQLNNIAHHLDEKRMTAIRRCDFCKDIVDVYSPSIWAGWYRGKYTDYNKISYKEAMTVNHFFHAEWGASQHAGRYSENPDKGLENISSGNSADERQGDFLLKGGAPRVSKDGDWSETYACNLIDWHLKEQENMNWLTGTAYWIFKDFTTPLRPNNPIPYVNQKGVVQRDLTPKESYYVFQSYWTTKPMVHIFGHAWETRWGDKDENKLIKVYSNCKEVEVFLNGKSLGKKRRNSQDFPASGLRWKANFKTGKNHIKAVGTKDGQTVTDEITFNYQTAKWKTPAVLTLNKIKIEGDTVTVCCKAYDKEGIFCPDAKNVIRFGFTGDGHLIDDMGTWNGSRKIQLYNGRACIKVKVTGNGVVSVQSKGIETKFLKF